MPGLRSGAARLTLSVVLLLASQLTLAGQLCRTVMSGSVAECSPANIVCNRAAYAASDAQQACCEGVRVLAIDCAAVPAGTMNAQDAGLVNGHFDNAAPPLRTLSAWLVTTGSASLAAPFPAATSAPVVPAYILYQRFLS